MENIDLAIEITSKEEFKEILEWCYDRGLNWLFTVIDQDPKDIELRWQEFGDKWDKDAYLVVSKFGIMFGGTSHCEFCNDKVISFNQLEEEYNCILEQSDPIEESHHEATEKIWGERK